MSVHAAEVIRPEAHGLGTRGFSLMEVIVATLIAAIAVMGLAHTFGLGRGQIDRFTVARAALAAAEEQMSVLSVLPSNHPALSAGQHDSTVVLDGRLAGDMRWFVTIEPYAWSTGVKNYSGSLRRAVVEVSYVAAFADTVRLERLFE